MQYDYYMQQDQTKGIRRYPAGKQHGERWDKETKTWTTECADRRSCELTKDAQLTASQAEALTK